MDNKAIFMKILIIGKNGQLGQSLTSTLSPKFNVVSIGRDVLDLSAQDTIIPLLNNIQPDVIINAAAFTAVDAAETQLEIAFIVNHDAVKLIAEYSVRKNIMLIHYSTDYVFDGTKNGKYTEVDITNPMSVYGQSKRLGEEAVLTSNGPHIIFRTSWVYSNLGNNFANTILQLATHRSQLQVVNDQVGCPTHSDTIATITERCIDQYFCANHQSRQLMHGLYHLTERDVTSWFDFAKFLIKGAEARGVTLASNSDQVSPISTASFGAPAPRPLNSMLDCTKLNNIFDLNIPLWQSSANKFIDNWVKRKLK